MSDPSLTEQLAKLIDVKPVTENDLDMAALFVLDVIANAIAGRATEAGKIILDWVQDRQCDEGRHAFASGALTHIVEMDDLHRTSVTHPGCVVIPAVIAVAEDLSANGHAVLRAVLKGYEACTRVGMAVGTEHYKIWHNTATCGPFGSAMAVASLLKLNRIQTTHALGNAGTQSSGLWQFLQSGAMSKHLHAGRAAESGLLAAQLASRGFTGSEMILEGEKGLFAGMCKNPNPAMLTEDFGPTWQLQQTSIKPWPSCRHTHPVIDAAIELGLKVDVNDVFEIDIETYQAALNVCDRSQPQSLYEAKFSLQHCVAAVLNDGKIDLASFDRDSRERLRDLAGRVNISLSETYESAYPDAWGATVSVKLTNGKTLQAKRTQCKGDPELPVDRAELIAKAKMLMRHGGLDEDKTRQLIVDVLALADNGMLAPGMVATILQP